jgi:hypothetical protein
MEKKRILIFYKDYFNDFFDKLPEKIKGKIDEVLYMIMVLERIPAKFFSHMTAYDGLYEIRIEYSSNIYRIFCCFDEGNLMCCSMASKRSLKRLHKRKLTKH